MGNYNLRFRRSVSFGGLFRLNFGKKGMSVSTGVPGARRTWHTSGRRTTTFGLPGAGVSWQKVDRPSSDRLRTTKRKETSDPKPEAARQAHQTALPATPTNEASDLELLLRANEELKD